MSVSLEGKRHYAGEALQGKVHYAAPRGDGSLSFPRKRESRSRIDSVVATSREKSVPAIRRLLDSDYGLGGGRYSLICYIRLLFGRSGP